jgi:hypothetical protein
MVIRLESELESVLNDLARRRGVSPESLVLDALKKHFLPPWDLDSPQDDWERQLREAASDCGVSLSDEAVSSEGIYE